MRYELYYWPGVQGRGEFVRLALEDAGAPYVDVARTPPGSYHAQTRTPTRLGFASIQAAGQCGRTFRVVSEKNVQIASVAEGPRGSL